MKSFTLLAALACTQLVLIAVIIHGFYVSSSPQETYESPFAQELLESALFRDCEVRTMECTITAYCPGPCCNTAVTKHKHGFIKRDWSNRISGINSPVSTLLDSGIEIAAVDPDIIPLGAILQYADRLYIALDTGSLIKGRAVDIMFRSHNETVRFGRKPGQSVTVFIPHNPGACLNYVARLSSTSTGNVNN